MTKPRLELFYDMQSPYSYLAYYSLRHTDTSRNCDVEYVPVLLIGLVKSGVGHAPWFVPNKVKYLWKDLGRCAKAAHVPWSSGPPAQYPDASTSALQRAIVSCQVMYPDRVLSIVDDLYHAFWVEKRGIQAQDLFKPIFEALIGVENTMRLLLKSQSDEARGALRANTERAIESGAVGLPWIVATDSEGGMEGFWGFDRLPHVLRHLQLDIRSPSRL